MTYRRILLCARDAATVASHAEMAADLARRQKADLVALHAMSVPVVPAGFGESASVIGPEVIEAQRQAAREHADSLRKLVQEALAKHGAHADWIDREGPIDDLLASEAHYADLVIVGRSTTGGFESFMADVPERLIMTAGRPVLLLPPITVPECGTRIILAWDGSREAARAAREALPLLRTASDVTVVTVGDDVDDMARRCAGWLSAHGIDSDVDERPLRGGSVGETLLAVAGERKSNLLVMGAYGHSRFREFVLGGATRIVLTGAGLPVLFAY